MSTTAKLPARSDLGLRIHATWMLGFLGVQYILGMTANLFVQFPQNKSDGQLWEFTWSQFPTAAHIIVGILLLISSIALLVRAIRSGKRMWIIAASVGTAAIAVAGFSGATFVSSQSAIVSFTMSLGFLVAFVTYGFAIYAAKRQR